MNIQVTEPRSEEQIRKCIRLRWEILRKPWNQPEAPEKDDFGASVTHGMICDEKGEAIAVGRLHFNSPEEAQVRFMAVKEDRQGQGLGKMVLEYLEDKARKQGAVYVVLQARDQALGFYKQNGYEMMEKTFLMFNDIQHYLMRKEL